MYENYWHYDDRLEFAVRLEFHGTTLDVIDVAGHRITQYGLSVMPGVSRFNALQACVHYASSIGLELIGGFMPSWSEGLVPFEVALVAGRGAEEAIAAIRELFSR